MTFTDRQKEPVSLNIIRAQYLASAVNSSQYPEMENAAVQIAFVGRSNVGKSSLLNSLARQHGLARISSTPGKTQTLNFYQLTAKISEDIRRSFLLVDLPGYGYARTGRTLRRQWAKFIEEYLLQTSHIKLICQLIDSRHSPMESDIATYRWLIENGLPVQVVATKVDKISKMLISKQIKKIKQELGMDRDSVIPYSSAKGIGRDQLLDVIAKLLLNYER
ncbi:hypothetical protein P22_0024 [Propionispora sp. 2/2-37]|uniref:ribosome biogenesis GTP-binding protein YihA/YsxC n=1 Tax=Propionispora sp. 2/2-37 TaxID=1677858 RepID=UPI0006BB791E|nr:ribosome biogenesis GTP-binding protein YihA/YsxC [Propionispora sp. 2/2-37]CUH93962.1 hypothetical protein P22_0024 [Propionispora sp. 2/2-37]